MKLLLVEDEVALANITAKGLRKLGYAVDMALDGEEALFCCDVNIYDLVILDLNLPLVDGMEVLRRLRKKDGELKILLLTARSSIEERVHGLDEGANDYLVKPYDFLELAARIRSLLRRTFVQQDTLLTWGPILMDSLQKTVCIDNQPLKLTKKEYSILEYLLIEQSRVLSAEEIIEHVWESDADAFSNAFKFHLHSLKKKIAETTYGEDWIQNVRGHGYVLRKEE